VAFYFYFYFFLSRLRARALWEAILIKWVFSLPIEAKSGETNYECRDVTKQTKGWRIQKTVSNWEIFFGWICHKHGQVFYDFVSIIKLMIECKKKKTERERENSWNFCALPQTLNYPNEC